MPDKNIFDVAIIGAGVVGCALARRLTLDGASVCVIEKAVDILDGASKGNSGILHTGFDAPVGSLELECIKAGYKELLEIKDRLALPVMKTGAVVIAWNDDQADRLPSLMDQARENGITDAVRLDRQEILSREPELSESLVSGFLIPGEFVLDPWTTPISYMMQALANGATLIRGARVENGDFDGSTWQIHAGEQKIAARTAINCAGLYGDVVDEVMIGRSAFQIRPRKGQFLVFDKTASGKIGSIILPVPSEKTKGVVVCPTSYGNILVGPTAEEQESRDDSSVDSSTLQMLRETAIRMVPALSSEPVTAVYAGIRPASEEKEYRISPYPEQSYVSVGGIRSTGLSAALGIAGHVAGLVEGMYQTDGPIREPVWPRVSGISEYGARDWQTSGHGGIVCHCELVTRREILDALSGPLRARSLAGLKRRTRATMGRCQGFYCSGELAAMTEQAFDIPIATAVNDHGQ